MLNGHMRALLPILPEPLALHALPHRTFAIKSCIEEVLEAALTESPTIAASSLLNCACCKNYHGEYPRPSFVHSHPLHRGPATVLQ